MTEKCTYLCEYIPEPVKRQPPVVKLINMYVDKVYHLRNVSIDFDKTYTNLTGWMNSGRTKLHDCFDKARAMLCTNYSEVPGDLKYGICEDSKISLTFSVDQYTVKADLTFSKELSIWGGEFMAREDRWTVFENGREIYRPMRGGSRKNSIETLYDNLERDVMEFLNERCIMSFREAIEHMGNLPYNMLSAMLDIDSEDDITHNLAKLIPWFCCFANVKGCLIWMDDIFDGIHELTMMHFNEQLVEKKIHNSGAQYIMSCRRTRVFDASHRYPCYFFYHGDAVKISKGYESFNGHHSDYEYAFRKEDDHCGDTWYSFLNRWVRDEDDRLMQDIRSHISSNEASI